MAQTPIISPRSTPDDIRAFRIKKLELKERDYPMPETKDFVLDYINKIENNLKGLFDSKTLLIRVPSGSGMNGVTICLQQEISHRFGAAILPDHLVNKMHKTEAKKNLNLAKRNEDPIRYKISASEINRIAKGFSKVVIIDDVIGSGESSIKLKKTLEEGGIKIDGLFSLVTVEKSYPKQSDVDRVVNKIDRFLKLNFGENIDLRTDIELAFGDYTKQKLNRVERQLVTASSAKKYLGLIKAAANIERQFVTELKMNLSL